MVAVICVLLPLTLPKLFGVKIYGVLTGSMTPSYPVGGVVYVVEAEADEVAVGDVITYRMGTASDEVITHRVKEIEDGFFITKGDANPNVDPEPVAFERLIGRVECYFPGMAGVSGLVNSVVG